MRRPSSIALRIEAKLSSVSTMSDASLATSEPASPIAMPTSARFSEGESLTPSPVMATKHLRRCRASIIRTLVWGAQRAMTSGSRGSLSISVSVSLSKSLAAITMVRATSAAISDMREGRIPTSRAMARAVSGWSPVSMWTLMPASWHLLTEGADSGRGGSYRPMSPRKTRSSSNWPRSRSASLSVTWRKSVREARARTRRPSEAMATMFCSTSSLADSGKSTMSSPQAYRGHEPMMRSTAPLVKTHCLLACVSSKMTDIFLTSESKGNSATCFHCASSPVDRPRRFQPKREA